MTKAELESKTNNLQDFLESAGSAVVGYSSDAYSESTHLWNADIQHSAALVVRCSTVEDIKLSLRGAQAYGFEISVHGGGHDWLGRSVRDGGLVLDLSGMRRVSVDADAEEATIGGGATAMDVCNALVPSGLVAVTGSNGSTGMAGLILGGGYGPLTPRFGLATDNLIAAEMVLANGDVVTADASHNTDLFWAIRGGGGNFGVVTSMRIRLHRTPELLGGAIIFPWTQAATVMRKYADFMSSAPMELSAAAVATVAHGDPVLVIAPVWCGEKSTGLDLVAQINDFGIPIVSNVGPTVPSQLLTANDAQLPSGRHYAIRTRWLRDLTPNVITTVTQAYDARTSPFASIVVHHFHGAGARLAPDATAFAMRDEHFTLFVYQSWQLDAMGGSTGHHSWASELDGKLASSALPGGYANLLDPRAQEQVASAYGGNARRLQDLKQRFDSDNIFSSAIPLPTRRPV